jgi:hypothetical protein
VRRIHVSRVCSGLVEKLSHERVPPPFAMTIPQIVCSSGIDDPTAGKSFGKGWFDAVAFAVSDAPSLTHKMPR